MKVGARNGRIATGAIIAAGALSILTAARSPSLRTSFSAAYKAFRDPSLIAPTDATRPANPAACVTQRDDARANMLLDAKLASDFQRASDEDLDDPDGKTIASLTMPDLRVPITRRTMRFVRFFARTEAGRTTFLDRYRRAGTYRQLIEHALREAGLPEDLVWMPAIESGYDPRAVSQAGAAGLWQFMPQTGAVYGLYQSGYVDERKSIVRATTAAVAHLRDLYERFGRWDLAIAAYNVGYDGVLKAMDRATVMRPSQDQGKPIDFAELAEAGLLPDETINYVPQISAFAIVAANRAHFGLDSADLAPAEPLDFGELAFPEGTRLRTIARAAGISIAALREYNPQLLRDRLPPTGGDSLVQLPADRVQRTLASFPAYLDNEVLGADDPDFGGAPPPAGGVASARAGNGGDAEATDTLPRRPGSIGHNRLPDFMLPGSQAPSLLPTSLASISAYHSRLPLVSIGGGLGWQRPYEGDELGVFRGEGPTSGGLKGREKAIDKQLGFLAGGKAALGSDPFDHFTLPSGIGVDFKRDPSAPRVAITIRIAGEDAGNSAGSIGNGNSGSVGAALDPDDMGPGFARGAGETRHTIMVAPRDFDVGVDLAAGRLRMLLSEASDAHVADLRRRASEPKRRELAETPYGQAWLTLADTLFPKGHPLAGTILGAREDAALTRDFFLADMMRQERSARRASITVVGEVGRDRAEKLLDQLIGPVASPLADSLIAPHPREERVVVEDGVPSMRMLYGWIGPKEGESGDAALRVAMEILIGAKQPRLGRVLMRDEQLASNVRGVLDIGPRASVAAIEIGAAVPHSIGEVERRMDAELQKLAEEGPTVQEVALAKALIKLRLQKEIASTKGPITPNAPLVTVSARLRAAMNPGLFEKISKTLDDVSPLAVKLIVRKTLTRDHRVVVTTVPRGGGSAEGAPAEGNAAHEPPSAEMKRVIEVLTAHVDEYVERSLDRVLAARASVYTNMPRHVLKAAIGMAIGAVAEDVARGTTMSYAAHLANVGVQRAKRGVPIAEMIRSLELGFQVISDHFTEVFKDDLEARLWWESRKHEISYAGALAVTDAFYETREAIITEQSRQLMALAAPILPLGEGILVLPIVGSLDEQRAARVIEALLASVVKHRSEVVIIDVTGMHAVDTSATEHLLRAARAARLLGATVLLVGIRAEAALAFTNAGADLGGITTLADLTRGLAHALLLRRRSAR